MTAIDKTLTDKLGAQLEKLTSEERYTLTCHLERLIKNSLGTSCFPLSAQQARLWFFDRLQPGSSAYNMAFALHVSGPLDIPTVCNALDCLVKRHDLLRARLIRHNTEAFQSIDATQRITLTMQDLTETSANKQSELARNPRRDRKQILRFAS